MFVPVLAFLVLAALVTLALSLAPSAARMEELGVGLIAYALVSILIWESVRPHGDSHFPVGYIFGFAVFIVGVWLMLFGDDLQVKLTRRFRNPPSSGDFHRR